MSDSKAFPWQVGIEQYKALEASVKPDNELIKLAMHVTKRLNCGKQYGHVVAYLYREWAHAQGKDATIAWWREYDAKRVAGSKKPEPAKSKSKNKKAVLSQFVDDLFA